MFNISNYFVHRETKTLKESGFRYSFTRVSDETGYLRYKNLIIDFPEGQIPLVMIMFSYEIAEDMKKIVENCLDSFFYLDTTEMPNTFCIRLKDKETKHNIKRISLTNMDAVNYPFLKCIHPERVLIKKGKGDDIWL